MKTFAWTFAALLGALSVLLMSLNGMLLWRELRAKPGEKVPSLIPILGGVLGFFAVKLSLAGLTPPRTGWSWWLLLPPFLDPGCYLSSSLIVLAAGRFRRR
ncbi:MAG: hypothetical protein HY079_11280 [Elusimicrobia bacterium]|nr:hypothetical protein [Elusimicrobiota bacterium]